MTKIALVALKEEVGVFWELGLFTFNVRTAQVIIYWFSHYAPGRHEEGEWFFSYFFI